MVQAREHSNFRDYTYQARFELTTHLRCMLENMRDSLLWALGGPKGSDRTNEVSAH
jgi:hypothetical protein